MPDPPRVRINNPARNLVLLPPIDGATAALGTVYFTENPGDSYKAWEASMKSKSPSVDTF
jgi:hypothetical protein